MRRVLLSEDVLTYSGSRAVGASTRRQLERTDVQRGFSTEIDLVEVVARPGPMGETGRPLCHLGVIRAATGVVTGAAIEDEDRTDGIETGAGMMTAREIRPEGLVAGSVVSRDISGLDVRCCRHPREQRVRRVDVTCRFRLAVRAD